MNPLPYRLSICGKDEVEAFAGKRLTHLLSIEDPLTPKGTPAWFDGRHHQIHFHDVISLKEAWQMGATAPTRSQVAEILRFGSECLQDSRVRSVHLLIHCYAGVSRSTAAGYVIAAQALGQGRAAEALRLVLSIRPFALPNPLVVTHADRLLRRKNELAKALTPLSKGVACRI